SPTESASPPKAGPRRPDAPPAPMVTAISTYPASPWPLPSAFHPGRSAVSPSRRNCPHFNQLHVRAVVVQYDQGEVNALSFSVPPSSQRQPPAFTLGGA